MFQYVYKQILWTANYNSNARANCQLCLFLILILIFVLCSTSSEMGDARKAYPSQVINLGSTLEGLQGNQQRLLLDTVS